MLHVQRRGNGFCWRRRVPLGLRSRFIKRELVVSLRTPDRAVAIARGRRLSTVADKLFARAMTDTSITTDRINAIARGWLSAELERAERELEQVRAGQALYSAPDPHEDAVDTDLRLLSELAADSREALAVNYYRQIEAVADDLIGAAGLSVDRASPSFGRFCRVLLRAQVELLRQTKARRAGDYSEPTRDPLFVPQTDALPSHALEDPRAKSMPLSELAEVFIQTKVRDGVWKEATARNSPRKLRLFAETLGNKPVDMVTQDDIRDWRDALDDMDLASNSIRQHFSVIGSLFNWAKQEGKASLDNPTRGLAPKADTQTREAFTPQDLRTLFHSPLYTGHWRADRRERPGGILVKDHKFWLPSVALHSGLRVEEAAKLTVTDLRESEGVWCFHVSDAKTKAGNRVVPVHPRLIRMGLLVHWQKVVERGEAQLWPELKKGSEGRFSQSFVQWWSQFRHLIGLNRESLVFHSFRHTFISSLLNAGVPQTTVQQIAGHAIPGVTGIYAGKLLTAQDKLDAIQHVTFGADLSHLEAPQG
ncbi:site-specific recombinase XerD [Azospirillum brasilense]|uniref:Site-specific recombinase XerD n=2 Tax=Azospirillum brasilense TaxID=192 RepID=A0A560AZV3_AZOBR|nr:site-specific recombinase XerD [Azospirillum brasilense]